MEDLIQKYADRVDFAFVYCKEAHPLEAEPIATSEERFAQADKFARRNTVKRTILVDDFEEGSVQKRYGALENSAFVLDQSGRILMKLPIAQPDKLDAFLHDYLTKISTSGD